MIIAYDVSHIRKHRAGIGRLATIQLQGLLSAGTKHEFILHGWSPELDLETIRLFQRPNVRLSVAVLPGTIKRVYWNMLRFPPVSTFTGRFDIFHSAEPLLPPVGKAKTVAGFNDSAYYKFPHFYSTLTARKWDYLYRRALRRANAITVLSENTRTDLIEMMGLPPEIIHVVRPPTDPVFSTEIPSETMDGVRSKFSLPEQFVLFVGTLEPRKNIPGLVRAFERFYAEHPDTALVIVGRRGWLFQDILSTIEQSLVRRHIMVLDYVSDTELAVLYRLASMLVFPSFYEGHGYPVVEAMISGTPVITSNNSSLKEIGAGAALLVDPENIDDIAGAMHRVLTDHRLRAELVAQGRERAGRFTVQNAAQAILHVYDSLL